MSQIRLIHGSCADEQVDAVVNAANRYLLSGGGICGVIFKKAGYQELTEACQRKNIPLEDGFATITPSFAMKNCQYIIHAVGPDFRCTPEAMDKLFNAYFNSMSILKENHLHSISFPLISSGIFSGNLEKPAAKSARECLLAYKEFMEKNREYEIDVRLCAFSTQEYKEAQEELKKELKIF